MNSKNFETISELKEYINDTMKLPSEKIFKIYLSKIFSNLLQREENINNTKSKRFSREQKSILFLQKDSINNLTPEKENLNLSLNNFLEYMDIQEFIGERIFKYLNNQTGYFSLSDKYTKSPRKLQIFFVHGHGIFDLREFVLIFP